MDKRAMFEKRAAEHGTILFYLYTYPVKFKCLPRVMVQEQLVCDDPRTSYEAT